MTCKCGAQFCYTCGESRQLPQSCFDHDILIFIVTSTIIQANGDPQAKSGGPAHVPKRTKSTAKPTSDVEEANERVPETKKPQRLPV